MNASGGDADRLVLEGLRLLVREVVREVLAEAPATGSTSRPLGTAEVAARAGVSADTVRSWAAKGLLRASRPPGVRDLRFDPADVEAFLLRSTGSPPTNTPAAPVSDLRQVRAKRLIDSLTTKGAR